MQGVSFFFFKLKLKLKPPPKDLLSVLRVAGSRCISKQRLFVQFLNVVGICIFVLLLFSVFVSFSFFFILTCDDVWRMRGDIAGRMLMRQSFSAVPGIIGTASCEAARRKRRLFYVNERTKRLV